MIWKDNMKKHNKNQLLNKSQLVRICGGHVNWEKVGIGVGIVTGSIIVLAAIYKSLELINNLVGREMTASEVSVPTSISQTNEINVKIDLSEITEQYSMETTEQKDTILPPITEITENTNN